VVAMSWLQALQVVPGSVVPLVMVAVSARAPANVAKPLRAVPMGREPVVSVPSVRPMARMPADLVNSAAKVPVMRENHGHPLLARFPDRTEEPRK
jgi:hypothetical protein